MVNIELSLHEICSNYGKHQVLHRLSASPLTGGNVVGLLGPNASGKSTLIKAIAQVHRARSGSIALTVDGAAIATKHLSQHIGYVPQDLPTSAALTAFETVMISAARATTKKKAEQLAADILFELKLTHLAHRYLSELSGGQRQMIAFAQMAASSPSIMLLDEPTSALDLNKQLFLLAQVRKYAQERGLLALVAIHDINLSARFCDELLVMKEGQLVAQGTPQELLTPELLREVFEVETEILQHGQIPVIATIR
ncbi:ABC transporter ATP-binding protein [uncultured Rothia sp.]|uniref:ABC transporter ATP-binding protein n=1 Tax=uncultured Rothia sp. TaxID=316088 RepID=UPI003217D302